MVKVKADGTGKKKRVHKLLPKKPKKLTNRFGAFLREFWPSLDAQNRTRASMREASTRWAALTPEQKNGYQELLIADRNRYVTETTLWKRQKVFFTRPANMYALFLKEVWQRERDNDATTFSEVSSLASVEWKALTDAQKQPYRLRFERARQNFKLSILDYEHGFEVDLDRQLDTEVAYVPLLPQPEQQHEDLNLDVLNLNEEELNMLGELDWDDEDFIEGDEDFDVGDEDFDVGDEDFDVGDEVFDEGDEDFNEGDEDFDEGDVDHQEFEAV